MIATPTSLFDTFCRLPNLTVLSVALLGMSAFGCGGDTTEDEPEATDGDNTGDAGNGENTSGDSGAETDPDTSGGGFNCVPGMNDLGAIDVASPNVSAGKSVTAGGGLVNETKLVDGRYHVSGAAPSFGTPTEETPAWAAIDLGAGPSRLLLIWADAGWTDYDNVSGGAPLSYRIKTSSDSTNGEEGTWEEVVAVADNRVRTRGHSFPFDGMAWVRFEVTSAQEGSGGVEIDELAIHDISAAGDDRPQDTWFFMGDSITKMAFERASNLGPFDTTLAGMLDDYYPAMLSGGIGGVYSTHGLEHIEAWLDLNPDFQHIALGYGTNDAWGNKSVASTGFDDTMRALVEIILDAGRVPHLATIPFSTGDSHDTLPEFNAAIEALIVEYDLPCGPDFYTWFKENPDEIGGDDIHPTRTGLGSINTLWAEAASTLYVTP